MNLLVSSNAGERPYPEIAQLLVVLGERPWIWRRIQVSGFAKLGGVHRSRAYRRLRGSLGVEYARGHGFKFEETVA